MPQLKQLSCCVQWADTNAPFQEFGTAYGDGVVETFIIVPNKPTGFCIRLTSQGYIYEGLAMVVFIDGNYQCNRSRVNLKPPKKGESAKSAEIDLLLRQKEKPNGDGGYMGRAWRFDNHNIISDPDAAFKDNHFEDLGIIEVLVLRCRAPNSVEADYEGSSSGEDSDIFNTDEDRVAKVVEGTETKAEPAKIADSTPPAEVDDMLGMMGLFDGAYSPKPRIPQLDGANDGEGQWLWQQRSSPTEQDFENVHKNQGNLPNHPYYPPRHPPHASHHPAAFARPPTPKRVHFDHGVMPPIHPLPHYDHRSEGPGYLQHPPQRPPSIERHRPPKPTAGAHPYAPANVHYPPQNIPYHQMYPQYWEPPAGYHQYPHTRPAVGQNPGNVSGHGQRRKGSASQASVPQTDSRTHSQGQYSQQTQNAHPQKSPASQNGRASNNSATNNQAQQPSNGPNHQQRSASGQANHQNLSQEPQQPRNEQAAHQNQYYNQQYYSTPPYGQWHQSNMQQAPPHGYPPQMMGYQQLYGYPYGYNPYVPWPYFQHLPPGARHDSSGSSVPISPKTQPQENNTQWTNDVSNNSNQNQDNNSGWENNANQNNNDGDGWNNNDKEWANSGDNNNNTTQDTDWANSTGDNNATTQNDNWTNGNDNNSGNQTTDDWNQDIHNTNSGNQSADDWNKPDNNSGYQNGWSDDTNNDNTWNNDNSQGNNNGKDSWGAQNDNSNDTGGGWDDKSNPASDSGSRKNSLQNIANGPRDLYGPHGPYITIRGPRANEPTPDAEEGPRYDVPQSIAEKRGSTKQVQPGPGYRYYKRRLVPEYIDSLEQPYARFVFKYRTKNQFINETGISVDFEPSSDAEVVSLQGLEKQTLVEMLMRAKTALGGKIPDPPTTLATPAEEPGPTAIEAPKRSFTKYTLPPPRPHPGSGRSTSQSSKKSNTGQGAGWDDKPQNNQSSWDNTQQNNSSWNAEASWDGTSGEKQQKRKSKDSGRTQSSKRQDSKHRSASNAPSGKKWSGIDLSNDSEPAKPPTPPPKPDQNTWQQEESMEDVHQQWADIQADTAQASKPPKSGAW